MRSGRHHRTQDPGRWSCRSARSSQRASFPLRPFPQRTKRTETRSDHCHEARQAQTLAQPRQTAPAAPGRRMGQRRHHHTWDPGRWSCRSPRSSQRASPARSEGRVHLAPLDSVTPARLGQAGKRDAIIEGHEKLKIRYRNDAMLSVPPHTPCNRHFHNRTGQGDLGSPNLYGSRK